MSRWDALKPSSTRKDEPRIRIHRGQHETKRKPQNTARKWQDKDETSDTTSYETLFRAACQPKLETAPVTALANLVIQSQASSDLAKSMKSSVKLVDDVFLPYLEKRLQERHHHSLLSPRDDDDERGISAVVQALCTLLDSSSHDSSSQHISSIMAPLVSEIQNYGDEIQISNPTRIRLFRNLQSLLHLLTTTIILEQVAKCLVVALKVATRIDGTAKHGKSRNYDLDPAAVYNFFCYCRSTVALQQSSSDDDADAYFSLTRVALELIKALMKRHPESSCTFTTLLLIGDRTLPSKQQRVFHSCSRCAYGKSNGAAATTMFLDMLHQEPVGRRILRDDGGLLRMAVDIVRAVLEHSPLSLWLQQQHQHHQRRQPGDARTPQQHRGVGRGQFVKTTASGFRERLSQGLENLTEITKCLIIVGGTDNNQTILVHGCALAGCIFRLVPFSGGGSSSETVRLQKSGCDLVQATVSLLSTQQCMQQVVQQAATEALLEGMGGHMNPQGELTSMCFPIKEWLSCKQGDAFVTETIELILHNVCTTGLNKNRLQAQLVRAMLRTFPDLFLKSKERWESLVGYMQTCSDSSDTQARLEGALALQSLMNGRKDFGFCIENEVETDFDSRRPITECVVPLLLAMLNTRGDGASIRCALLTAYGSMLPNDWHALATSQPRIDHVHINLILDTAQESQTDKVRSEACKSIGNICTSYFSASGAVERVGSLWDDDDSHGKNICEHVCQTLISMLEESHRCGVLVRASVVLALGNLVHALRDPSIPVQCPATLSLVPACILAEMAEDKDAKISGNAIRTFGHVTCLLFREDYSIGLASLGFDHKWLLRCAIQAFTSRLQSAVMLARGELSRLNWKERAIIKKHAGGSCNSLASIFGAGIVSSVKDIADNNDAGEDADEDIRECLSYLLQCVEELHKVHEKVVVSSMAAICAMDSATLSRHCGKQQLSLTKTIVVCIMLVYKAHNHDDGKKDDDDDDTHLFSAKVTQEAALLLEHMLRCCSISDAADVLRSQSISIAMIDFLYQWMLEKDCPTTIFNTFALAMQKPNVQVDVQTEQRFASQAMSLLCQYNNQADEL